jgi:hypothetical protein
VLSDFAWKKFSTWVLLRCSDFARKKQQVAKMTVMAPKITGEAHRR